MSKLLSVAAAAILSIGSAHSGSAQTTAPAVPVTLRIAAASDLRYALDEVMTSFRALHPEVNIDATYGSSGNFFAQIGQGGPFDVFLSADSDYTRRLFAEGMTETPFPYAIGRLALVVRKDTGLDPKGFGDLLKAASIRRIAIANPAHAPYGRAAEAALKTWKIYDAVSSKLVLGDSVSQAAQFVDTGAAQAGLVALSLVKAKGSAFAFAEVPETAYPPIDQAGVVIKRSGVLESARTFQKYLTSEAGRAILTRYGFGLPQR
ncbi:MAG: molybdate ABC transporter substrate-binding protein [Vicinamibacteria bacterium]